MVHWAGVDASGGLDHLCDPWFPATSKVKDTTDADAILMHMQHYAVAASGRFIEESLRM
jgi:hypothetical protein